MNDIITTIGNSILQHGKYNDRIYLMKLSKYDCPNIIDKLDKLALVEGYSKIFAKVPASAKNEFTENGYLIEAYIPQFYKGYEDVYFMGKYFTESRMLDDRLEEINEILGVARSKAKDKIKLELPAGFSYKICDKSNVFQMAEVYKQVFETYPFPIYDPQYIMKIMDKDFIFFGVWKNNMIVALSSSEMDAYSQNVEMTDFATLPDYRGNRFAVYLLNKMENEMQKRNVKLAYTIARTVSYSINIIFASMGYKYSGTLLKNTNISGNFESMNVWHKFL
ncbi:Beta-lysine N6-acetyltransferase [uncultured archaeon]|nr:Beta-lysine N6-acetyltransferase [uncultured archaeon]